MVSRRRIRDIQKEWENLKLFNFAAELRRGQQFQENLS
jgi:hypothetical protein